MTRLAFAWMLVAWIAIAVAGIEAMQTSLPDCRTIARLQEVAESDPALDYASSRIRTMVETSCAPYGEGVP